MPSHAHKLTLQHPKHQVFMHFKKFKLLCVTFMCTLPGFGQIDTPSRPSLFNVSGFSDAYYLHDFDPQNGLKRQDFLYNHNRKQAPKINLALVAFHLHTPRFRSTVALQAGTYVNDNYADEPHYLKPIHEANIGWALTKNKKLWIDVGVMPSYIGFESAIGNQNWTLSRSLLAENSPYFVSGGKLSYQADSHWNASFLVLNGWQRIQPLPGNTLPSIGTQWHYRGFKNSLLSWSTFFGSDDPDSSRRNRFFNNFYLQSDLNPKWGVIIGFDIGMQQQHKGSHDFDYWMSPVFIAQYHINKSWKTSGRLEYYHDPKSVIIGSVSPNGFQTFGASYTIDYQANAQNLLRLEWRQLRSNSTYTFSPVTSKHHTVLAVSWCWLFDFEHKYR